MTRPRVDWTNKELRLVAEAWLIVASANPGMPFNDTGMTAQARALGPTRQHARTWFYRPANKALMQEAVSKARLRLANRKEPPTPPAETPLQGPMAVSQPPVADFGAVSAAQAGGDLGATFEALFERLGEAFGRGFRRALPQTPTAPQFVLDLEKWAVSCGMAPAQAKEAVEVAAARALEHAFSSDPAEARANVAERERLNEPVGLPRKPKVLVLGGAGPDHADLRKEIGEAVDLRLVGASRRRVKHALAAWNGSPVIAWTRYCSHGLVQSAKYHSPQNVHYVAGQLGDVVAKIKELTMKEGA